MIPDHLPSTCGL